MMPHLTRPLVLESPQRLADGAGGFAEIWAPQGTLWAEMSARTGREAAVTGGAASRVAYRITVRASPPGSPQRPAAGQRFRDGGRLFRVIAVAEHDTRGRYLDCLTEEETAR